MHDAVELEKRGIPTAVIVTDAFLHEAEVQRTALGADLLNPAVIQHPLSTLSDTEIESRAKQAATAVISVLVTDAL